MNLLQTGNISKAGERRATMKAFMNALLASLILAAAIWAAPLLAQPETAPQAPEEDVKDFPALPGREETFGFCVGCHNFKLVAAQGMTRERWDETMTWMTQRHGMADIDGEPRALILDYLAQAFPEQKSRQPGGWQNPFSN